MTLKGIFIILAVVVFTIWLGDVLEKGITKLREQINRERRAARESVKDAHEEFPGI